MLKPQTEGMCVRCMQDNLGYIIGHRMQPYSSSQTWKTSYVCLRRVEWSGSQSRERMPLYTDDLCATVAYIYISIQVTTVIHCGWTFCW